MSRIGVDIVFIVLTYRNTEDLKDFINSTATLNLNFTYKIVVVNSYYDERSKEKFEKISLEGNCDFINVENKGYGYGNNQGIEFAKKIYDFQFLIISNPDIEIKKLNFSEILGNENKIIAPSIRTLNNKQQNPHQFYNIEFLDYLKYVSFKKENKILLYFALFVNKVIREFLLCSIQIFKRKKIKIFAPHGSFMIFGHKALSNLGNIFDEEIFLYCEEDHLARLAKNKKIEILLSPELKIIHREDGSVGLENKNPMNYIKKSYITFYEKWKK